jgi:hypothetical protein
MKLKLDGSGNAVLQDGKPVYVHDDGKEVAFDAPAAVGKIKELADDRDNWRKEAGKSKDALQQWEPLGDPKAAREMIERAKSIKQGELIEAGQLDKVKQEIQSAYEATLGMPLAEFKHLINGFPTIASALNHERGRVRQLTVGSQFGKSGYFAALEPGKEPRTFLTPDLAEKVFGEYFEPADGGRVVAKVNGNVLQSRDKPGEPASFDEAIGMLIDSLPHKNAILRDVGGAGSGALGGAAANGAKASPEIEKLAPVDRLTAARTGAAKR